MKLGIIEYNEDGQPKCEICGEYFDRVIAHARQKHDINEREYKLRFGLDLKKGVCSKKSHDLSSMRTLSNYDKCVNKNLMIKGESSRYVKGSPGRTKDKVSEQTKIMLEKHMKQEFMTKDSKARGEQLGKSGLGNEKRWGKKS